MLSNNNVENWKENIDILTHIDGFHNQLNQVLSLDKRETEANTEKPTETGSNFNIINAFKSLFGSYDWFGGVNKQDKPSIEEVKAESTTVFFGKLASLFSGNKPAEKSVQIVVPAQKTVLPINDKMVKSTIHDSFQQYADEMIGAAKGACFDMVIKAQKEYSSCMIRRPGLEVDKMGTDKCEILEKQAEFLQENCLYVFPMATAHDELIAQFMEKSLTTEAVLSDKAISFKAHNDESIFNLIYVAYEEGKSPQELLASSYSAPNSQQQAAIAAPIVGSRKRKSGCFT